MPFSEALRLALATIWSAKLRSFFTLLGIIVSVAFLVTVVAVIQGMNAYVAENITGASDEDRLARADMQTELIERIMRALVKLAPALPPVTESR